MKKSLLALAIIGFSTCSLSFLNIPIATAAVYQSNTVTGFYGEYVIDEEAIIEKPTVTERQEGALQKQMNISRLPVTGEKQSLVLIFGGVLLAGGALYRLRYVK